MSKGTGISPEDLVKDSALQRLLDYKISLQEVININNQLERATIKLGKAAVDGGKNYAKAQSEVIRLDSKRKSALRQLNKDAKKNSSITKTQIKNNINLKKTISRVDVETKKLIKNNNKLNRSYSASSKAAKKFNSFLRSTALAMASMTGFTAVGDSITKAFNTLKKLDSLNFTLRTLIQNEEDLIRTRSFLKRISNSYGADIIVLTERYIKFLAAANQSNLAMSDSEKIYESLVKSAGVLGLSQYELEGALLAVEQMISKGKVTTEELRRQLAERLPGAFGTMADAIGVTVAELDVMLKKGEVLSSEALPKFADAIEKAYGIENVDRVETLIAAQTRYNNAWVDFVEAVENGNGRISKVLIYIYDLITETIKLLTPFNQLKENQLDNEIGYNKTNKLLKKELEKEEAKLKLKGKQLTEEEKIIKKKEIAANLLKQNITDLEEINNQFNIQTKLLEKNNKLSKEVKAKKLSGKGSGNPFVNVASYITGSKNKLETIHTLEESNKLLEYNLRLTSEKKSYLRGEYKALINIIDLQKKKNIQDDPKPTGASIKSKSVRNYNLKDLNTYNGLLKKALLNEIKLGNQVIKDNKTSYKDRIEAINNVLTLSRQLAAIEKSNSIKRLTSTFNKDISSTDNNISSAKEIISFNDKNGFDNTENKKKLYELYSYKKRLEVKFNNDKISAEQDYIIKLNELENESNKNKIDAYTKFIDIKKNIDINNINTSENNELSQLAKLYKADEINFEEYEKRKKDITEKYAKERLELNILFLNSLLTHLKELGDVEGVARITEEISKLNKELNEFGITDTDVKIEKLKEFVDLYKDVIADLVNSIGGLVDAIYERNISYLENRLDKLEEFYDRQYQLAAGDAAQQRLIRQEEAARTEKLKNKIAREKTKQAKTAKAFAIFNATINTAGAIIGYLANPGGPTGLALSILAGITGAAQIAAIAVRPIPKFKDGHLSGTYEGIAITNDGRKNGKVVQEVHETKHGSYLIEGANTPIYMKRGEKIYRNLESFNELNNDKYKLKIRNNSSYLISNKLNDNSNSKIDLLINETVKTREAISDMKTSINVNDNSEAIANAIEDSNYKNNLLNG